MFHKVSHLWAAMVLGSLVLVTGCGSTGVEVTGKATKGGAAFTPGADEKIVVLLRSPDGQQFDGTVGADGAFKITGPNGVPPGNYSVSYMHYVPKAKGPPNPKAVDGTWAVAADKRDFTLELK